MTFGDSRYIEQTFWKMAHLLLEEFMALLRSFSRRERTTLIGNALMIISGKSHNLFDCMSANADSFDDELLEEVLFYDDPPDVIDDQSNGSPRAGTFGKMSNGEDLEENLKRLKHPPIWTQRTVPTVSTSAPRGVFTTQHGLPARKLITQEQMHPSTPIPPRSTVQKFTSPEDLKPSPQQELPEELSKESERFPSPHKPSSPFTSPSNLLWRDSETSPKESERTTRTTRLPEQQGNSPHILAYEETDSIVGTVPRTALLKQIKLKNDVTRRLKNLQKSYGSFTTISSLSFDAHLTPDTPKIVLGDPKTASKRILITVGVHGDEPCGLIGFNELLSEDFFATLPDHVSVSTLQNRLYFLTDSMSR